MSNQAPRFTPQRRISEDVLKSWKQRAHQALQADAPVLVAPRALLDALDEIRAFRSRGGGGR